jgi:hypothetical protein
VHPDEFLRHSISELYRHWQRTNQLEAQLQAEAEDNG